MAAAAAHTAQNHGVWRIRFDGPSSAARFEAALRSARAKRPAPSPETIRRSASDVIVETAGGSSEAGSSRP